MIDHTLALALALTLGSLVLALIRQRRKTRSAIYVVRVYGMQPEATP